jgi:hypothetical protein
MKAILIIAVAILTGACAGSLESAKREGIAARRVGATTTAQVDPDHCRSLDSTHRWWGGGAQGAAFAAGGSGLSTIFVEDNSTEQKALAWSALGVGIAGAFAAYVSSDAAESYARDCSSQ